MKNYSIRRSAEYLVIESDRLKYHVQCRQFDSGCQWSLCVALLQNLGYWEVRRFGGPHSGLAPTMSQDHHQLDSSLICRVILPMIQSNPSVSIPVLQGAVHASYHFKSSYRKVWMAKQKAIARSTVIGKSRTIRCQNYFRHCRVVSPAPFVTYTSNRITKDGNSNILPIAFAIVESESTESWSFFLTNLRHHVTPQDSLLVISNRSLPIKATLGADDSG
ncbi:uncharacterized protein LOC107494245 [Arachis duranensis]|uniref:Uncharacterized protein LOC107494245 n=1 Tax=Arachis duranensis TaxID=130453 RepID=A0A6P4DXP2_ARADU|nr:uncharacterized protein LOC107494245 [Arachis duranensis]